MQRSFKKQTRQDFRRRVKHIDPSFFYMGERAVDQTPSRPALSLMLGFGWAFLLITIGRNRSTIEASLTEGNLPPEWHVWVTGAVAGLLAVSLVMLALHVLRLITKRGGKRRNSGALLTGALCAGVLVYTPTHVWQAGFDMLDGNSQQLLRSAALGVDRATNDIGAVAFVSSIGKDVLGN